MQNQEIVKIIENLKGRKNYEEKRASKLGFASLYSYFEDKILKKQILMLQEMHLLRLRMILHSTPLPQCITILILLIKKRNMR